MTNSRSAPCETPLRVLPSHEGLLNALARFDQLTAAQTCRLLYKAGSLTLAQSRLRELADAGYVQRVSIGRSAPHGSGPYVYRLGRRGRRYLIAQGVEVSGRLRQSEERVRSPMHLRHSGLVVDVLILCELFQGHDDRHVLARMHGERYLRGHALPVIVDGSTRTVAPDAWIEWRIHGEGDTEQQCVAFEIDAGTEWQTAWRRKVRGLLAYETGPYRAAFGVDNLTVAVVAQTPARALQLWHWTEAELATQGAENRADLIRFGVMPTDLTDAAGFFLAPRWMIPGGAGAVPLIAP